MTETTGLSYARAGSGYNDSPYGCEEGNSFGLGVRVFRQVGGTSYIVSVVSSDGQPPENHRLVHQGIPAGKLGPNL